MTTSADTANNAPAGMPPVRSRLAATGTAVLRGGPLFRRWFAVVTAGEFLGFSVPAVAGALTAGAPALLALAVILAAGAVEGTMLGLAQAVVLRRALPTLPVRRWVAATAAAAVLAYAVGMLPSLLAGSVTSAPPGLLIAAGVVLGAVLLLSIGTAQWLVLRPVVAGSGRWVATTALAWTAGLGVFLAFTMPLWRPGQSVPVTVVIGVAGGLLMAAAAAAITGDALRRLLRHHPTTGLPDPAHRTPPRAEADDHDE